MFPPYVANLRHSDETILYQIRESEGKKTPAVKDLIIANTINSLIVFNVCYCTLPPSHPPAFPDSESTYFITQCFTLLKDELVIILHNIYLYILISINASYISAPYFNPPI